MKNTNNNEKTNILMKCVEETD